MKPEGWTKEKKFPICYTTFYRISHKGEIIWSKLVWKKIHPTFKLYTYNPVYMQPHTLPSGLLLMLKFSFSRRQSCGNSVAVILRSRALLLWSGDTCLWYPHIQPQSGLLHQMSGTQISSEERGKKKKSVTNNRPATLHPILKKQTHICLFSFGGIPSLPGSFFHLHWELAGWWLKQI